MGKLKRVTVLDGKKLPTSHTVIGSGLTRWEPTHLTTIHTIVICELHFGSTIWIFATINVAAAQSSQGVTAAHFSPSYTYITNVLTCAFPHVPTGKEDTDTSGRERLAT